MIEVGCRANKLALAEEMRIIQQVGGIELGVELEIFDDVVGAWIWYRRNHR